MNISIVYWSGTGNTEAMAIAVAAGAEAAGAEVKVLDVSSADESVLTADAILFGCPAMGAEELENSEFLPFFERVEDQLKGKKSAYSARTVGAAANGCGSGRNVRKRTALF